MELIGSGTERLEEELREYFPQARVSRLDADVSMSKTAEEKVLKEFAAGQTDILVGTQMVSKGFDFPNLSLVAVINADSLLSLQDFRADERALQLITQLAGRSGRREGAGRLIIQTYQPEHRVFQALKNSEPSYSPESLEERKQFGFPPVVRLVEISVRDGDAAALKANCERIVSLLKKLGINDFFGPITPQIDKVRGKRVSMFWIKLPRTQRAQQLKARLAAEIEELRRNIRPVPEIVIDVDPI